jgi:hypothetical protein
MSDVHSGDSPDRISEPSRDCEQARERETDEGESGESPTANSRFMPLANWPPNLLKKKKKKKN